MKNNKSEEESNIKKAIIRGITIAIFIILFFTFVFGSFYTIRSGQEGVLLTWNKANPISIEPGIHLKFPIAQKIIKFDIQTQKYGVDATQSTLESAASSDLQIVKVRIALNYHLSKGKTPEIFTNLGPSYEDKVILPSIHESVKAAVSKYSAENLIKERELVRADIENLLKAKLAPYNIIIEQVSITDFDFSEQFNTAIEAKVTAEQNALKAQNDLGRIQIEAQQAISRAEGEKQAIIKNAEAEAEKLKLVNEQLERSPQYIEYIKAQRWDGKLPTMLLGGSNTGMLLELPILPTNITR